MRNNREVISETNTVMLCVKPKDIVKVLKETSSLITNKHLVLSIAAGIELSHIQKVNQKHNIT